MTAATDAAWSTAGFVAVSIAFAIALFVIGGRHIGASALLTETDYIGVGISMLVIVGVMTVAVVASLLRRAPGCLTPRAGEAARRRDAGHKILRRRGNARLSGR